MTGLDIFFKCSTTHSTAIMTPLRISTGFAPLEIFSKPSFAIARASTVAAVVPSPADSLVLLATSWTSFAPMFWNLSLSSMPLATVTPSLVILGEPHDCSRITLRPYTKYMLVTASYITSYPSFYLWSHGYSNCISENVYTLQHGSTDISSKSNIFSIISVCIWSKISQSSSPQ